MTWTLSFPHEGFRSLRARLLAEAPAEAGAFLLAHRSGDRRLLVRDIMVPPPAACTHQGPDRLEIEPAFVAKVVKRARREGESVVLVHTHPTVASPRFSLADDHGEAVLIPAIAQRVPEAVHGALVIGKRGFAGRVYVDGIQQAIDRITEVGPEIVQYSTDESGIDSRLYDRNVRAFGREGQQRLRSLTVGVVGLGGTGSIVAQQLAHLGVGGLFLVDHDRLQLSNLNRVVGARRSDVGLPKVEVAGRLVREITGGEAHVDWVLGDVVRQKVGERLLRCDLIFSCTDSQGSRAVLNQLAYQHLVPVIDMGLRIDAQGGTVEAMSGRVQMLAPGLACLQCARLLDPEVVRQDLLSAKQRRSEPYIVGDNMPQPAVISLNGVIASLAVNTFLAAVTHLPIRPRRLNYRVAESIVKPVESRPSRSCPVCSPSAALARGNSWPMIWRPTL